jgi:hypothetical protein
VARGLPSIVSLASSIMFLRRDKSSGHDPGKALAPDLIPDSIFAPRFQQSIILCAIGKRGQVDKRLGRYELRHPIGRGAARTVWNGPTEIMAPLK